MMEAETVSVDLPPVDHDQALPYSAIRYVAGYPEHYLREYALKAAAAERERCAKLCEQLEKLDTTCQGDNADLSQFARAIRAQTKE